MRILRFFRFLALFGKEDENHEIEIAALNDLRDGLDTVSAERKSDEILKLFAVPDLKSVSYTHLTLPTNREV